MSMQAPTARTARGDHFSWSMSAVALEECQAMGAARCVYQITWGASLVEENDASPGQLVALRHQLEATKARLRSVFATASDLIAVDDLDNVLARITARAALEVRAPRYLLVVRSNPGGRLYCHHKGFDEEGIAEYLDQLLHRDGTVYPDCGLVVPVASNRRQYGRLLALRGGGDPRAFRVRLDGPPERRVQQAMGFDGSLDRETAERARRQFDRTHAAYFQQFYGVEVCDPKLYHLALDSTAIELEVCVELIAQAAEALRLAPPRRSPDGPPR